MEAYTWPEGQIWIWSGSATASALVGFAQNMQFTPVRGWDNRPSLDGTYRDHLTGQRADLVIGQVFTHDSTIQRMEASATAYNVKLVHSGIHGSAGVVLSSGRIDSLALLGSEGNPYVYQLTYHCNQWSAF